MIRRWGVDHDRPGARAQSTVLGLAIVFGLVITGAVLVVVLGSTTITDAQTDADVQRAHKTLTQFDSQAALVALGASDVQHVSLPQSRDATYRVHNDTGWMNVSVTNTTSGSTEEVMNATLGSVVYTNGETTVAYQGGGVWTERNGGAAMVSPPEFYYRDATLTLPLVTVTGDAAIDGRTVVRRNGTGVQRFPNATASAKFVNPLENGKVNVTVQSEYYLAWGTYFEERTDGDVEYDHDEETVRLTLVVPAGPRTVGNAVAATSSGGEIKLSGSGTDMTRTDSYNSTLGSYADTKTDDGTITTAGDVTVTGNSKVNGSVRSGGTVEVKGSGEVKKDVYYTDDVQISGTVGGDIEQISGVEGVDPIDSYVQSRYDEVSDDPDGDDDITGTQLDGGAMDLGPGQYHLTEIELDGDAGDVLVLDTGVGETIEIAVRDNVLLKNDGAIQVQGTGEVRIYVKGENTGPNGDHFHIANSGGIVDVATDENASQFWVYGDQDLQAAIDGNNAETQHFEGIIYAPAGQTGSSDVFVKHGEVFGGVVTGDVEMDNGGGIHYDKSLGGVEAVPPDTSIIRLTYLHVSENRVWVTSG